VAEIKIGREQWCIQTRSIYCGEMEWLAEDRCRLDMTGGISKRSISHGRGISIGGLECRLINLGTNMSRESIESHCAQLDGTREQLKMDRANGPTEYEINTIINCIEWGRCG